MYDFLRIEGVTIHTAFITRQCRTIIAVIGSEILEFHISTVLVVQLSAPTAAC